MSVIVIKNLNDNEIVRHKLVLIKGFIFVDNDLLDCEGTIELENETISVWPVSRGRFKCVCELKVGENKLYLKFRNIGKSLKVVLKFDRSRLKVTPLYVVCKGDDGRFQAPSGCDNSVSSACRRISLGLRLIQIVFFEKLKEHGFRKCFQLESDLDPDVPLCRVFKSTLTVQEARSMEESELWEYLAREIMCSQLGNEETKFLAFLSCTYWNGESIMANPALGGGGLALLGSACLHTWPEDLSGLLDSLNDHNKIDPSLYDNSCFRGTYGGCYNTSLGSACHELGHMFNLGHSPSGIMSRGFDHVGKIFLNTNEFCDDNLVIVPYLNEDSKKSENNSNRLNLKEDDKTHFTKSCATILAYHKWFNGDNNVDDIHYDCVRNILSSENGLKVVQLRTSCGAVIKSWELGLKAPHRHFILPRYNNNATLLFAMDINGNMLSHNLQHNL